MVSGAGAWYNPCLRWVRSRLVPVPVVTGIEFSTIHQPVSQTVMSKCDVETRGPATAWLFGHQSGGIRNLTVKLWPGKGSHFCVLSYGFLYFVGWSRDHVHRSAGFLIPVKISFVFVQNIQCLRGGLIDSTVLEVGPINWIMKKFFDAQSKAPAIKPSVDKIQSVHSSRRMHSFPYATSVNHTKRFTSLTESNN